MFGPDVRCLTLCAPFASLVADGRKRVENRSTRTTYRGEVLIHAGLRRSWGGYSADYWSTLFHVEPTDLRFGVIVAVAQLVACVRPRDVGEDLAGSPHVMGPWCWILAGAVRLATPVPLRGKLGLYPIDPFTVARVRESLPLTDQRAGLILPEAASCR